MKIGIIGAGPAGLFTAWLLKRRGADVTVFEARSCVGGISRSFQWHGFTCDLGAHRLFTQDESILRHLLSLVPMGRHVRRSQLYLAGKWVSDPVNVVEILYRYFPVTTARILVAYACRPGDTSGESFNDFVYHKYGTTLGQFFFQPYTEKMFGIPGSQISIDYARRKVRISGFLDFLRESSKKHFQYFYYPMTDGFGAIVDRVYQQVRHQVRLNAPVVGLKRDGSLVEAILFEERGRQKSEVFDVVISTLPLNTLGQFLGDEFPLKYQSVDFVYLLVDRDFVSDNHWIYYIDKGFAINRLIEFKNLSSAGQPTGQTVLCAEVTSAHDNAVERVCNDVIRSGLVRAEEIVDTKLIQEDYAYAVFDLEYAERQARVNEILGRFSNLHSVGRAAQFRHLELDDIYANALSLAREIIPDSSLTPKGVRGMAEQMKQPKVFAVILAFNHYDDTQECLQSLLKIDYQGLSVLLVDNGSSDGTPQRVVADFPTVEVIETGENLGVPWGYNVGFSHALRNGAEYILMLNNDTVVDPAMLDHLLDAARSDSDAGILVPKILYYDDPDIIWSAGGRHRRLLPAHVIVGQNQVSDMFDKPFSLEYAISCGLLIHRRAFEKAGLFDPGYFFFFDDWDFSHRVRAHGLHITFVPEARMWHKVSKSTRETGKEALFWKVWGESSTRFYRRHGQPVFLSLPVHLGFLMIRELVKGNRCMLKHFWAGVRNGLTKPLGPIPSASNLVLPPTSENRR